MNKGGGLSQMAGTPPSVGLVLVGHAKAGDAAVSRLNANHAFRLLPQLAYIGVSSRITESLFLVTQKISTPSAAKG